ncbi:hypothetical protein SAMN05443144_109145 [Fodinibius roseus]|nr:hypothetical protein [Fodinibius roseus]SHF51260.1 hypothetical protein SAMN05443144_109145 [Fodinibius roseus]
MNNSTTSAMKNAINHITTLLAKVFSIVLIAGLVASCASVADSGFEQSDVEEQPTTVDSDTPEIDPAPTSIDDEMDPIITGGPRGGR